MGRLVYSAMTSLDGYVNDGDGTFDWAAPDAEVHAHANDAERDVSTHLFGRRMYEVMSFWDDVPEGEGVPAEVREFADLWSGVDKIVYSTTLDEVRGPRTQLRRSFDPDEVRALVDQAPGDVSVGGPGLAAEAIDAGLVDEIQLYVSPVAVGPGGTSWVRRGARLGLEQRELRRFGCGVVFIRYAVRSR